MRRRPHLCKHGDIELAWSPAGGDRGSWSHADCEQRALVRHPAGRYIPMYRTNGLLQPDEVSAVLKFARACDTYDLGPDSVDGRPTFEIYACDRGVILNEGLWGCIQHFVRHRLEPWVQARYGVEHAVVCTVLLRRYLEHERRVHPAHFDAHAYATCVVGLNPSEFGGGLYIQPAAGAARQFVSFGVGDAILHQYDLRHGVDVTEGERFSLIFWLKENMESCIASTTPWCLRAVAFGDADAAYNLANLLMKEGACRLARKWFCYSATAGQADSAHNLAVMYYKGIGAASMVET